MKDVSFIIVSWNAKKYLIECLSSIRDDAGGVDHEVIVVDNASTDGSQEAVKALFPEARLIGQSTNTGFAAANNAGIRESKGRYIFLVNSDIKVIPGCIGRVVRYLDKNRGAGLVGPRVLNADGTLQLSCRRAPSLGRNLLAALGFESIRKDLLYHPHDRTREVDVLSGCFIAARREAVEEAGLLDERFFFYAEDKDWCKRLKAAGWKIIYLPEAVALHYGGKSSANAPLRYYIEMHRANLRYWAKHHGGLKYAYLAIAALHQSVRVVRGEVLSSIKKGRHEENRHKVERSLSCLRWIFTEGLREARNI
ncbi:MAG: glycosyltransferase family 2 protein [Deltaproteobacteria bacterium]|nr:glycosyltransferase family 2 protein [Deltaproteobacteria bacterium]